MRLLFAFTLLLGTVTLARTQQPEGPREPEPRFGLVVKLKAYPQDTAKKALASAIEAIDRGEISYLLAHLLDPAFVEARLTDRAKQFEPGVEDELVRLREFQIRNANKVDPANRVPLDPVQFRAMVKEKTREQAFRQLLRDVQEKMRDDPESLKDMKKLFREGTVTDLNMGAKITHMDVKDRALFFRKIGDRWFLENRQEELPPKKEPGK